MSAMLEQEVRPQLARNKTPLASRVPTLPASGCLAAARVTMEMKSRTRASQPAIWPRRNTSMPP
jgi:hypothetical protein